MYRPGRIVNFETLLSRTFYDAPKRSFMIILSVGTERRCLMILNIFNKKVYIVNQKEKKDVTQSLLKDVEEGKVEIIRASNSATGTLYVLYLKSNDGNGKEICEISPLASKQFQSWLVSHYGGENVPSNSKIQTAVETIERRAAQDESIIKLPVFTRVGYLRDKDGEKIYLCLHNKVHSVIKITREGFPHVHEADIPMIFENTGNMSSLVVPKYERNNEGKIDALKTLAHLNDLRKYVNVNDEGRCLVIAWLLISLYQNPNVDAPILWIEGERNTGKTTASKFLKRIVAPDYALMLSQYVNENSLSTALNSQYVSVIDNVSTITPKLNDMLCRAVTDDKIRTVTTENGTFKIRQHANIIVNSLDTVSKTPELRERTFCVRTTNLPPENRLSNEELETSFQKDAPYILGGLIVALWLGLGNKNYAHSPQRERQYPLA